MRNPFPATSGIKSLNVAGRYPVIPATWPNRAVRRAVQRGRPDLAPGPWRGVLAHNAQLVQAIQGMALMEFVAYPKTPRLKRDIVITEKIDGTNAQVVITKVTDDGTTVRGDDVIENDHLPKGATT